MFDNVLVGVGSERGGRDAIALARKLVGKDGRITLAHVHSPDARRWDGTLDEFDVAQRGRGEQLLTQAREEAGVDAELAYRQSSSVGRGLHELAETQNADLLVVGSSARGLLGRVLIGDDACAALDGAPCAVAIAPTGYSDEVVAMREIGVGYNGTPESEHAIAVGRALAARYGTTLSAFEAVSLPSYAFLGGPVPVDDTVADLIYQARDRIRALGGVAAHAAYGAPVEELALYSASLDLLIVGSRAYGPLGRLVHGSTSRQLARACRCPLLVLTRAARAASASDAVESVQPSRAA